jgi:hypothetical protein
MEFDLTDTACRDCGVSMRDERYVVTDETWRQSGLGERDGFLCLGCLEARLGRRPENADFVWTPLNVIALWTGSERLKDRLNASAEARRPSAFARDSSAQDRMGGWTLRHRRRR